MPAGLDGMGRHPPDERPLEHSIASSWEHGYELDVVRTARLRQERAEADLPVGLSSGPAAFVRSTGSPETLARMFRRVESTEGWLWPPEIQFLFAAARQTPRHRSIVEIGSWKGRSTAALALGALAGEGARVFAIDHHHGAVDIATYFGIPLTSIRSWPVFDANLHALGIEKVVTPVLRDSLAAEAVWEARPIGLLWIDGGHDYEIVASDFDAWRRHVPPGGVIAVHDTTHMEGPLRVVEEAIARGHLLGPARIGSITFGLAPEPAPERREGRAGLSRLPARRPRRDRISLIMPTRNEGGHLRKTIDSLLENTFYPDYEVLVLDDASDDGSCDFLLAPPYADDERLRLIRSDSQKGHVALRIDGARLATGSVLQFLDSHHWFGPYWLTNLYDCLRRHDFRVLVGPVVSLLDPATWRPAANTGYADAYGWSLDTTLEKYWTRQRHQVGPGGRVNGLSGHQVMLARRVYDDFGGLCPLYRGHGTDDFDFCLRAFLFGYDSIIEPTATIAHLYKCYFTSSVTWLDLHFNYLVFVTLNLGEEKFEQIKATKESQFAFAEALALFETLRPQVEQFRRRMVEGQRRSTEDLLESLVEMDSRSGRLTGELGKLALKLGIEPPIG